VQFFFSNPLIRRRGLWLLASGVEERSVWGKERGIRKEGLENRGIYVFKLGESKDKLR